MRYFVTLQKGGMLVCSNCFCANRTVLCNKPMAILSLTQNGTIIGGYNGVVDDDGKFCVTNESRTMGGI
jgi:hypothetical protein